MTLILESRPASETVQAEPKNRVWTRVEFQRLADDGFFDRQRVQLFQGTIIQMPPQGLPHSIAIELLEVYLRQAFAGNYRFRAQMPFHTADDSAPEPDMAVISGTPRDALASHPQTALLIVEVADTSLRFDRAKAAAYAASKVAEYWIVNLVEGVVEVHRDPGVTVEFGNRYASVKSYQRGESISPLAALSAVVGVNELLP